MHVKSPSSSLEKQLWRRLAAEHRRLQATLIDVGKLVADGSFETARKRFGAFRMSEERHLIADRKLLVLCEGSRELERFLDRVRRNRERILEQTERVWARLCQEKVSHIPRMLARLANLVAENEEAQRRLILADLPLSSARRRLHRELLVGLGAI